MLLHRICQTYVNACSILEEDGWQCMLAAALSPPRSSGASSGLQAMTQRDSEWNDERKWSRWESKCVEDHESTSQGAPESECSQLYSLFSTLDARLALLSHSLHPALLSATLHVLTPPACPSPPLPPPHPAPSQFHTCACPTDARFITWCPVSFILISIRLLRPACSVPLPPIEKLVYPKNKMV